ncbi:hypothetical protein HanPI659440_Chr04g0165241 [Helianthus annuus]|nr:hypothetical protein HanPI659440_Chr04g0165241 [Helianthus annuus]
MRNKSQANLNVEIYFKPCLAYQERNHRSQLKHISFAKCLLSMCFYMNFVISTILCVTNHYFVYHGGLAV